MTDQRPLSDNEAFEAWAVRFKKKYGFLPRGKDDRNPPSEDKVFMRLAESFTEIETLEAEIERLKVWGSDSHVTDLETKLMDAVAERSYAEDIARAAEAKLAEAYRDWNTESKGLNGALAKAEYEARENHERAEAAEREIVKWRSRASELANEARQAERRATDAEELLVVESQANVSLLDQKTATIAALRRELADIKRPK